MEAKGFVVPPGGGRVWKMATPGRSATLKLLSGQTAESLMLFDETVPPGTVSTFHLHHDSDEVAYVLSGEITFRIGEEVTIGGPSSCAFIPRAVPHAWKNTGAEIGRVLFLYTPAGAGKWFEERVENPAVHSARPTPRSCIDAIAGRSSARRHSENDEAASST